MAKETSPAKGRSITFHPIGTVHTPYNEWAPNQPVEQEKGLGKFKVVVDEQYVEGLHELERFEYVILICHLNHGRKGEASMTVAPPWAKGKQVGLFASRSPHRPNPIGISIVKIDKIEGNVIYTWPIDVYDGTPLLDIKPYIATLDAKSDANDGWTEEMEDKDHLLQHVRGIPHDHHEGHGHHHGHEHGEAHVHHEHEHTHENQDGTVTRHVHEHRHDDLESHERDPHAHAHGSKKKNRKG